MTENKTTLKTALYIRVSTDAQAEKGFSIDAQIDKLRAYCNLQGIDNFEEYVDAGYSAGNLDRPEIKRLINDVKMGNVSTVVVYKLDRLSRKTKDTLYIIEDVFNKNDIKFVSLTENIDTSTSSGKFFISILSSVAQLERENIRERGMLGMKKKAEMGFKSRTPKILIGYDYDAVNKKYTINDYEAMQIKEAFNMFTQGESIGAIFRHLYNNYTTKYGKWKTQKQISLILDNEAYIGRLKHQNAFSDSNNIPPIIDIEIFEKARELRDFNKAHYYRHTSQYLLTGIIYCAECGARLRGYPKYDKSASYYVCYSRDQTRNPSMAKTDKCTLPYFNCEPTDEQLLTLVKKVVQSKAYFDGAKSTNLKDNTETIEIIEKEIKKLSDKASKILDLFLESGLDKDAVTAKLIDNNAKKQKLNDQLQALKSAQRPRKPLEYEKAKDLVSSLDSANVAEKRLILKELINKIVFYKDKTIKVEFNF